MVCMWYYCKQVRGRFEILRVSEHIRYPCLDDLQGRSAIRKRTNLRHWTQHLHLQSDTDTAFSKSIVQRNLYSCRSDRIYWARLGLQADERGM